MKLNPQQRYALWGNLVLMLPAIINDHSIVSRFDDFCDEQIKEWRIIYRYGFAGKIWNYDDRLYITGYSPHELSKKSFIKQQKEIDKWNDEIKYLLAIYS